MNHGISIQDGPDEVSQGQQQTVRVLLLEDSADDAELILRELRTRGFSAESKCVASGSDFLAALSDFKPALVLSDYKLPDLTAVEALTFVKEKCAGVPFILVTGALGEEAAVEVMKTGATDYIPKDRLFRLVPAVRRALQEAKEAARGKETEDLLRLQHLKLKTQNQKLFESEQRFRQLAETIREVFWMTDPEKRTMIYISPGYEAIWGRTCQSLSESPGAWVDAIHPGDRDAVMTAALSKQTSGEYDEVYRIIRPDGSIRWIHDRAFPIRDESGRVYRIAGIAEDITRRKLVEQALQQAEANYRSIYANAQEGIFQTTPDGRYLSANPSLARMLGYSSAEELIGSVSDIAHQMCVLPESRVELKRRLEDEGYIRDFENQIYRKDGRKIWISVNARAVRNSDGQVVYYEGTSQDITKRKEAEIQLATLAHAVQSTGELISITDLEDRFAFVNQAFLKAYGYREHEILGKTPSMLFSDTNPPTLLKEILDQTRLGGWRGEVVDRRKDGSEIPIFLSTSQVRDQTGRVIGLMGVAQDVTERKQAEKEIRLLADAVQGAHELICVSDQENRFIFANRAFLETYGYRAEEILGRKPDFLYSTSNPPYLCEEIFQRALVAGWQGELLNRKKDGTEFPISLSTSQIRDRDGRIVGLVGVARDISERKRAERQAVAFSTLGYRLSSATGVEQAAEILMQVASELFGWDAGYVHLYSQAEDVIHPVLTVDTVDGHRMPIAPQSFTLDPSPLMRLVMKEGARLVNRDNDPAGILNLVPFGDRSRPSASMMYVPIRSGGDVIGILSIQSYVPRAYSSEDLGLLQTLADYCGGALQRIEVSEALEKAEVRYRGLFENATEGIFQTTVDGRYLNANPALARMFGYQSSDELIATITNIEAQTFASKESAEELKLLLATNDSVLGFEAERFRKDGSRYWTSINVRAVRDKNGALRYYEGTVQDITSRKRAEWVLRKSEEKFRTLFESAPIGMALLNRNGKYIKTNGAYRQILGYSEDELMVLGHLSLPHPEDTAQRRELFQELLEGRREQYRLESRYLHKDGRTIWGQSSDSIITDGSGNFTYVISMIEDVSEQKRFSEALQDSERNLRLIAENTQDVIFAFDMERTPLYVNSAVHDLTGYTLAEIQKRKFINWIHPEDQGRMLKQWEELYAGRAYADVEFRLVTKGGQIKWCSSTWGPLYDESGKQIGVQGRERDITERKELEQVVLETTANERRRIGYELHDGLGQLLVGIALKTKTLEENLREGGSAHVGKAKEVVALLNTAIGQTRSLAQGSDPVHVEADGLVAALEKLAATSENLFGVKCVFKCTEKRIRLETQSGPALYRIAQEGIRNAVEHGKARCIEMELETDAIQVCLRIRDNGSGFSPQLRTTGMGLHIMRYRATSIGGSLSISSEPDRGTELRCAAPLKLALPKAGTDFIRKRS